MKYFLTLWCLLGCASLIAQPGWTIGGQVHLRHTAGDLSPEFLPTGPTSLSPAASLWLERRLTPTWGLLLEGQAGWLQGRSRAYDWQGAPLGPAAQRAQAFNFRSQTAGGSLQLSWHPLARRSRRWDPYLRAGAGWLAFAVYGDLFAADGSRYHYWDDGTIRSLPQADPEALSARFLQPDGRYETRLDGLETEGVAYATQTWIAPLSLGLRRRLSERAWLGLEARFTLTGTDYLDDLSGRYPSPPPEAPLAAYAANPGGVDPATQTWRGQPDGRADAWASLAISLSYRLGRRYPRFRAVSFYAGEAPVKLAAPSPTPVPDLPPPFTPLSDSLAQPLPPLLPIDSLPTLASLPAPVDTLPEPAEPLPPAPVDSLPPPAPVAAPADSLPAPLQVAVQVTLADSSRPAPAWYPAAPVDSGRIDRLWQAQLAAQAAEAAQFAELRERLARLEGQLAQAATPDSLAYWKAEAQRLAGALQAQHEQANEIRRQLRQLETAATQPAYVPPAPPADTAAPVQATPVAPPDSLPVAAPLPPVDSLAPAVPVDTLVEAVPAVAPPDTTVLPAPAPPLVVTQPVLPVTVETPAPAARPDSLPVTVAPRPVPALAPAPAAAPQLVLGLAQTSIFFDKGRQTLLPADTVLLDELVTTLQAFPALRVRLTGYADKTGNPAFNLRLSEARAAAVQAYLEAQGIAAGRIETAFFGDRATRYQTGAFDRRVDIELLMQ